MKYSSLRKTILIKTAILRKAKHIGSGWIVGINPIDYVKVLELEGKCPSWGSF